jgi:hypothetical protein
VIERQPDRYQENDVGYRNPRKYGDPVDRQRRGEPEVIELIQPLFDPPDVRISGQVHLLALLSEKRSVDPECVCYSRSQRLDDAWGIEDHGNRDGEDDELNEPGDLTSKKEEERDDTYYSKEQWPEKAL